MDPDDVSLIVDAVAVGAAAGAKATAAAVVKDGYAALKAVLTRREVEVSGVERRPSSESKQESLREDLRELDGTPDAVDEEMLAAARRVVEAVAVHDAAAAEALGVDLARVRAAFLRIADVAAEGTGVRARDVEVAGGIEITGVRAGPAPSSAAQGWGTERPRER